jgi:hypothetical protein
VHDLAQLVDFTVPSEEGCSLGSLKIRQTKDQMSILLQYPQPKVKKEICSTDFEDK